MYTSPFLKQRQYEQRDEKRDKLEVGLGADELEMLALGKDAATSALKDFLQRNTTVDCSAAMKELGRAQADECSGEDLHGSFTPRGVDD